MINLLFRSCLLAVCLQPGSPPLRENISERSALRSAQEQEGYPLESGKAIERGLADGQWERISMEVSLCSISSYRTQPRRGVGRDYPPCHYL